MVEIKVERSKWDIACRLIFLTMLISCTSDGKKLEKGWSSRDEYMYDYISVSDSLPCDLLFHVNLKGDYRYKNLNFELLVVDPQYKIYRDTLSVFFSGNAEYGGADNHLLISDMILHEGDYRFRIKQVMCDTLWGVKEINLRIVPKWGKIK